MNYVFVNKAEPETKSRTPSSPVSKPHELEQYEKQYLDRLKKEPVEQKRKKVSRSSKTQSKKSKVSVRTRKIWEEIPS